MKRILFALFFLWPLVAMAQNGRTESKISYIESTPSWYIVYDENGKVSVRLAPVKGVL